MPETKMTYKNCRHCAEAVVVHWAGGGGMTIICRMDEGILELEGCVHQLKSKKVKKCIR